MSDTYDFDIDDDSGRMVDADITVDGTPNTFVFLPRTNATPGVAYTATAAIAGVDAGAELGVTNGELSSNGGSSWTTGNVYHVPGLTFVRIGLTASGAYNTAASKTATVNGVSATFIVTTGSPGEAGFTADEYYHYIAGRMRTFLASAPCVQRAIQVIKISHSELPQIYYFWREPYSGSVTLDDESVVAVAPLNMEIKTAGNEGHLDQKYDVVFDTVDITDEFREALDGISINTEERVMMGYYEYLSDDLTTPLVVATLQIEAITYNKGAARFSAVSPRLNMTRTGQLYSYREFPTLRGFL